MLFIPFILLTKSFFGGDLVYYLSIIVRDIEPFALTPKKKDNLWLNFILPKVHSHSTQPQ